MFFSDTHKQLEIEIAVLVPCVKIYYRVFVDSCLALPNKFKVQPNK